MLTSDQLDALTGPILDLYEEYTQSIIQDIARRLAGLDYARPTAAWQVQRLTESGALYEDILQRLSVMTGKSESVLRKIFQRAGVKAMQFDDEIYRAAGLKPLPLNLSPAMAQVLAAGLQKTNGLITNLTRTTAITGQEAFIAASDLAYMQVSTGAMSYTQAIQEGVKNLAREGLSTIAYAGRRDQLDVAVRRAVLTGVNQTAGQLTITRAEELGVDLVETSAHIGARPTHQVWQGKVFSRSGASDKYPPFVQSTGYGTGPGLCGWNCRHSFYPWFEGISEKAYSQAELDSYADKTVTYKGQEMSMYDATQEQRAIERKIRYWKRQAGALDAAGLENSQETAKVREWQARMRDFTKQTGLVRQSERERVIGAQSSKLDKTKSINKQSLSTSIQFAPFSSADNFEPDVLTERIKTLNDPGKIVQVGSLPKEIREHWPDSVTDEIILTGERRNHYLTTHREMESHESVLPRVFSDFNDIQLNKTDSQMAIYYLKANDQQHYYRIAVWISADPTKKNSIHSFRFSRQSEYEEGLSRSLIKKPGN